jgi:hypothetical protein
MRKVALMQHGKEAYKKLDKFLSKNMKYDFNSGKGESFYYIVDNVPYTKYDKPIGPIKPVAVPEPEKKPKSYYQSMIDKVLKEHVEPKVTKPKAQKESKTKEIKETKVYTMYKKAIGPVKPKETKPYTMYGKAIGPVKPINIEILKKN